VLKPPLVALQGASLVYPGQSESCALCDVDFALHEGERVCITGDNGSGKTSLLLALVGLRPLAAGKLLHKGKEVHKAEEYYALRREVGLVFQNSDDQLFSPTVIEDVAFGPLNLGVTQREALETARRTLQTLGIEHLENRLTHTLSGGQKRIVCLATALALTAKALLLDEPTNDLDRKTRRSVQDILLHSDLSLVLVSHDQELTETLATRSLSMQEGHLLTAS